MAAPSIVASVNAATTTQITTTAPSGSGGLLVFIAGHDTGSDEPFGIPNDFGTGTVTDVTGHLISNYTAMPAAANVLQVWSKPDSGAEPASYVLDIMDAASGGSALNRSTIFAVCRVTHPDGVPTVSVSATDVNDAGSSNEPVNPSVTTTDADNLVAYIVGWDEGKTLSGGGAPSGTTELFHSDQTLHDLLLNYFTQATAGATGTGSWNISSGTRWCAATLAFAPPAVSSVTGTGAATLGLTASGSGAHGVAGTASAALALTASASGTATPPAITGAGDATLVLTAAGSGTSIVPIAGTGAATLALTASGMGARGAAGTGSATLGFAASASGNHGVAGQGAATLGLTASASGTVALSAVTGTGSAELIIVGEGVGSWLGWVGADVTPESWAAQGVTAEAWAAASATPETWAAQSPADEAWIKADATPETWT